MMMMNGGCEGKHGCNTIVLYVLMQPWSIAFYRAHATQYHVSRTVPADRRCRRRFSRGRRQHSGWVSACIMKLYSPLMVMMLVILCMTRIYVDFLVTGGPSVLDDAERYRSSSVSWLSYFQLVLYHTYHTYYTIYMLGSLWDQSQCLYKAITHLMYSIAQSESHFPRGADFAWEVRQQGKAQGAIRRPADGGMVWYGMVLYSFGLMMILYYVVLTTLCG